MNLSLIDGFNRPITYLRISVTDKCNLRCVYCMPEAGLPWLRREEILSYEEIAEIVAAAASVGVRSIRLTGGEPLVRRDLARLVSRDCCGARNRGYRALDQRTDAGRAARRSRCGRSEADQSLARYAASRSLRSHRPASRSGCGAARDGRCVARRARTCSSSTASSCAAATTTSCTTLPH